MKTRLVSTDDRMSFVAFALYALTACANAGDNNVAIENGGDSGAVIKPNATLCPPCVMDTDCPSAICAQFGGDTFCAKSCSGTTCAVGTTCTPESSASGDPVSVCVPNDNACGASVGPSSDAGIPQQGSCPGLADPNTAAQCICSKGQTCSANGCYGGWWCDTMTNKCQAPPTNCGTPGASVDAGGPITSTIGNSGGNESRLYFAIVGDTRPATIDDTTGYPTATIDKIFSDVTALNPKPPFVIATGDYQFSTPSGKEASNQLALYSAASASYRGSGGIEFPAMGNHECTGATDSNCATTTTSNYDAFVKALLTPIGKTTPYYSINVNASDNSWTAKFVFVAANAWDQTQSTWLDSTLAATTTYTFVIRHESASANTAPGVTPSEAIMAEHPLTLAIVGHTHTYYRTSQNEVIFGNGGAPLTSGSYGFGLITQRSDLSIQVDAIDMNTGLPDTYFRFALHPDGTKSP